TARSMHVSVTVAVLLHMAGVFHVVALSIVRYFSLKKLVTAKNGSPWFSFKVCKWMIIWIFATVVILAIPLSAMCVVARREEKRDCIVRFPELRNVPTYELQMTDNELLVTFNFWMF
ncbi:hypothetical protein PMAYCL1PPCAC_03939, partial [Pristionchus mayeri]